MPGAAREAVISFFFFFFVIGIVVGVLPFMMIVMLRCGGVVLDGVFIVVVVVGGVSVGFLVLFGVDVVVFLFRLVGIGAGIGDVGLSGDAVSSLPSRM